VEKDYLADPDQVELIEGAPQALKLAADAGYRVVILSNQSGVARGYFTIEQVERVNGRMLELLYRKGVKIDAVYFCPYYAGGSVEEFAVESNLRKPRPGMPEQAAGDLSLDLRRSVVIGDKADDVNLGRVIGARSLLVLTGHGKEEVSKLARRTTLDDEIVFEDILSAVKYAIG
jgi:D-glycero-D-manno-heptose 1,7-bisphosphate phosphatase